MAKEMKIAVCGAGIGGLTAAAFLADQGHNVVVFDQFAFPAPVGSGLVIQPVGQTVLDRLGAGDAARAYGNRITQMLGHESEHGRRVLDVLYDRNGSGRYGLAIHRAALFDAIYQATMTRDLTLVADAKVSDAHDGWVTLEDGRQEGPFDLVVDATGAKSTISRMQANPLPYGAVWGTVDWTEGVFPIERLSQKYKRASQMCGVMPCGTMPGATVQKAAIFWSLPAKAYDSWRSAGLSAWHDQARALWPEAAPFIEQITDIDQLTMASYSHGTMPEPYGSKLAVIGDAAHRASPQLGQGANMALLDALALSQAVAANSGNAALEAYAKARRWHVRIYQLMSWAFTPQYQSDSTYLPVIRDRVLFPMSMIPPVPRILTSLVCGTMVRPMGRFRL